REVGERHDENEWADIFEAQQETVYDQKGHWPNDDLYASGDNHFLGIATDLMTPMFALARMAGWTAHVREQYADNKVIRPGSEYVGPTDRVYEPIDQRG
ncbi:MAG: citrate synthase, partial [Actinomycetota bacterium]|nr:citrate synthase [Actinomycetota bacterium]